MQEREKQHRSSAVLLQQWRCKCFLVQGAHSLYSTRWKENVTRGHSRSFSSIIAVSCQCTMLTNFLRTLLLLRTWLFPWCNSWKPRQSWETTVVMSFILLSFSYCLCHNLFYFPWTVSLWMCFIVCLSPSSCSSCMGREKLMKYFHLVTLFWRLIWQLGIGCCMVGLAHSGIFPALTTVGICLLSWYKSENLLQSFALQSFFFSFWLDNWLTPCSTLWHAMKDLSFMT